MKLSSLLTITCCPREREKPQGAEQEPVFWPTKAAYINFKLLYLGMLLEKVQALIICV